MGIVRVRIVWVSNVRVGNVPWSLSLNIKLFILHIRNMKLIYIRNTKHDCWQYILKIWSPNQSKPCRDRNEVEGCGYQKTCHYGMYVWHFFPVFERCQSLETRIEACPVEMPWTCRLARVLWVKWGPMAIGRGSPPEQLSWWRHQMETFFKLLALCAGNSPVPGEFPAQRPVTRSLMFSLICARINGWVNKREAGDLRRYRAYYDVIVMLW